MRTMTGSVGSTAALLLLLLASAASAQDRPVPNDSIAALELPIAVASAVVDFYNDPRRTRFEGDAHIAAGEVLQGDIAVLEGALVVEGRVEGSIVVVNGDAHLHRGATITGDLLVVGGEVTGADLATVHGEILWYPERLRYRQEGRRIIRREPEGVQIRRSGPSTNTSWGQSDFLITTGKSYNRVEGLPITFGPRFETAGSNPFRIHALAIYRTEAGFTLDTDQMGYYVRAEQFLGGRHELRLGASAYSMVDPIEEWHLSDLENGLATFIFHRDFRDHYERKGGSAFALWEPRISPLTLGAEVRWERHQSLAAGSPWTIFQNAEPWREQPLVAEGDMGSVTLHSVWDTRRGSGDPAIGWYARGEVEQTFHAGLTLPTTHPELVDPGDGTIPRSENLTYQPTEFSGFRAGRLDVRRYNRLDPQSRLNFRLVAGASLSGDPLPPQRQFALGGEGSLPGYELFSRDCGARDQVVHLPGSDPGRPGFFSAYGCDAFALVQAEYRGKLAFRLRMDSAPWDDDAGESGGWGLNLDIAPDWVLFLDAGRAWSYDDARRDEEFAVDLGAGIVVNRIGLYVAAPLTGSGGLNLFVRLGPRF